MDVVHSRCAGLDVHQATVVATARVPADRGRQVVTQTFGTMTADLLALRDWLQAVMFHGSADILRGSEARD
jgi:hypothetical protein